MALTVSIHVHHSAPHQWEHGELMAAGLRRHGVDVRICARSDPPQGEVAVVWGTRRRALFDAQRASGRRVLVMERGYVGDRMHWTSLGYDGLNGHADFCNRDVTGDRWEHYFDHLMMPWRPALSGSYALIMGQVEGDMSVAGVDLSRWYAETAREVRQTTTLPVRFRPHPLASGALPSMIEAMRGSLEDALRDAAFAVTWNSNSAVDAVLAGVPAITMDRGSMAWEVSSHEVGHVALPHREEWAHRLAWCQWQPDEIASGAAWDHLRAGIC